MLPLRRAPLSTWTSMRLAQVLHLWTTQVALKRLKARRAGCVARKGDTHMENAIGFAAIAGAIFISFAVALSLQWMSLVVLMKLMPARNATQTLTQRVAAVPEIRRTSGLHRTAA
jgi:hypothetical protein